MLVFKVVSGWDQQGRCSCCNPGKESEMDHIDRSEGLQE